MTDPEQTVEWVRPFMPAMGITRLANVTGLDLIGLPVVMVCRPNARCLSVAQGKGLDLAAAQASGLMESIETYHAERITLPLMFCSYRELQETDRVVDAAHLPRTVGSRFHPNCPLHWIAGHDLLSDELVWVPYELVHADYTVERAVEEGNFITSSNGLASGNHLLEAISHGICEVVERDAAVLWRLLPPEAQRATRIDLATVDDAACCEVLERYERAGIAVSVWEMTSDVGIPSYRCTIEEGSQRPPRVVRGFLGQGCHPDRTIALLRALTEAA